MRGLAKMIVAAVALTIAAVFGFQLYNQVDEFFDTTAAEVSTDQLQEAVEIYQLMYADEELTIDGLVAEDLLAPGAAEHIELIEDGDGYRVEVVDGG